MGPNKGPTRDFFPLQPEITEAIKIEILEELEELKPIKVKLAKALQWLNGSFKAEEYKAYIDAHKSLGTNSGSISSADKLNDLDKARQSVSQALSQASEMQDLNIYGSSKFKHFNDYCASHEFKDIFDLRPMKPGQRSFSLTSYQEKLSQAQIILDNYINNNLFFLTSKQESLTISPIPEAIEKEEEKPIIRHGKQIRPE